MSNVIFSASDLYQSFLRDIRKYRTTTVVPNLWNPFINECAIDWVKSKLPLVEFSQKRIDDLGFMRIVTDGSSTAGCYAVVQELSDNVWEIPLIYNNTSSGTLYSIVTSTHNGNSVPTTYPLYLHGLNASFKLEGDNLWTPARILKSDKRVFINEHYYRKPKSDRLYFEVINNTIRLIGNDRGLDQLRLEYIRYPKLINYDVTGANTLDPEFNPSQNNEIKNLAVRRYLEIIQDPRYKSFLNEEGIRAQVQ